MCFVVLAAFETSCFQRQFLKKETDVTYSRYEQSIFFTFNPHCLAKEILLSHGSFFTLPYRSIISDNPPVFRIR